MLDLTEEPDLGYVFYPYEIENHPGHPRLDVIITQEPTGRHFDPEKVHFEVLSVTGDLDQVNFHHPWAQSKQYRVCPGMIMMTDRRGKRIEAFSFGGDLQILSAQDHTVLALSSSAPIFPLFTAHDLPMWIVAEVEILLAEQEAHWSPQQPRDFKAHLGTVDPLRIYACCLQAMQNKGDQIHCGDEDLDRQGVHFVNSEIERIREEDDWPASVPALDQLC